MKICCIKTTALPKSIVDSTGSFSIQADFLENQNIEWLERQAAEINSEYKQLIPYVILQKSNGKIACYKRHGTETRLHGFYSCGFGGHIEECDKRQDLFTTVEAGMLRELTEEVSNFDRLKVELKYLGIINEIETNVGLVHLGLVYLGKCKDDFVPLESDETKGLEWKILKELKQCNIELWTKLALKLI